MNKTFLVLAFMLVSPLAAGAYYSTSVPTNKGATVRVKVMDSPTDDYEQNCTGTVIGPTTVLTAEHCNAHPFGGDPVGDTTYEISFVADDLSDAGDGIAVTNKVVYQPQTGVAGRDFLILQTASTIPAPIAAHLGDPEANYDQAFTMGWGWNPVDNDSGKSLRGGSATIVHTDYAFGGGTGGAYSLVVRGDPDDEGKCGGDSGGGVYTDIGGKIYYHSTASSGNCNDPLGPNGGGGCGGNDQSYQGCVIDGPIYSTEPRADEPPAAAWIAANIATASAGPTLVSLGHGMNVIGIGLLSAFEVDVSAGPRGFTCQVSIDATANPATGVGCVTRDPTGTRHHCMSVADLNHVSGWDIWECQITIPQNSAEGLWELERIWAVESTGNVGRAAIHTIEAARAVDDVKVVSPSEDITGPTISNFTVTQSPTPGSTVTCDVTATDSSGVLDTTCTYRAPDGGCTINNKNCEVSCAASGGGQCTATLSASAVAGNTWTATVIAARDNLTNLTKTSTGGQTSFTVASP